MRIGYFLSSEEYSPDELLRQARLAEESGFAGAVDLRPFPPLERRTGSQSLRLVDDRCARAGDVRDAGDDRRDVPDRPAASRRSSPRPRRPPRCCSADASRSAWGPVRRSTSTSSATAGRSADRAPGDARGGRRGDPRCCGGRRARATGAVTTASIMRASTTSRPSHRRSSYQGSGRQSIALAAQIGDGFATVQPDADAVEQFRVEARRRGASSGRAALKVCLGEDEARVPQRPHTGCGPTTGCPASSHRSCRPRPTSSRRGARHRGDGRRAGPLRPRSGASDRVIRALRAGRASTSSTYSRSAVPTSASSRSTPTRCCRTSTTASAAHGGAPASTLTLDRGGSTVATEKQRAAARKNVKKAQQAAAASKR